MSNISDKFSKGNRKRLLLFLFSCLIFFGMLNLSCKKKTLTGEYFPHKDGAQWKYKIYEETNYFTREFSGTTQYGDLVFQNWVRTEFGETGNQIFQDTYYIMVTDTTVIYLEDLDSLDYNPYIFLKLPLALDNNWGFYFDESQVNASIVSEGEEVSVQAGTYSNVYVVKYDYPDDEETRRIYYAPNVGIIKDSWVEYGETEPYLVEELVEYPVGD
jgi:hypothetical protein